MLRNIDQSLGFCNEACLIIVKGGKIHRRDIYNNVTKQHWSEDLCPKEYHYFLYKLIAYIMLIQDKFLTNFLYYLT